MAEPSKNTAKARITVEWGYDSHSVTLAPEEWANVKSGKPETVCGDGYYYEGEFFQDYWHFGGGLDGSLEVTYGDGDGEGFDGSLSDAEIKEIAVRVKSEAAKNKGKRHQSGC